MQQLTGIFDLTRLEN